MNVHFIAIGGSAMHNLALALKSNGHNVTGSDDEIYEPSLSRLKEAGICPDKFGWYPDRLTKDVDVVILGMHARKNNPELQAAQQKGLTIMSYPEFVYSMSKDKKRVVIAGSHGKTTTTSIIIHVLNYLKISCDYLVGAQLEGFQRMVQLTQAPLIILEGDEYFSSPIDSRSKFQHYDPDISVITGVSWDHINVFPTEEDYNQRFVEYVESHGHGVIYYCDRDHGLVRIINDSEGKAINIGYGRLKIDEQYRVEYQGKLYPFGLIGGHNLENTHAALLVCEKLGVSADDFFEALESFKGAGKRLQKIYETQESVGFLDFAHAPSKVKATTEAVKDWYPAKPLIAVFELHTFSSLNKDFLPRYKDSLNAADQAIVFYDKHTIAMKKMDALDPNFVRNKFGHPNLHVYDDREEFHKALDKLTTQSATLLLMTSGNLGKYDLNKLNRW